MPYPSLLPPTPPPTPSAAASSALTDGERAGIALGVLLVAGVGATLYMHCNARTKQVATLTKGIPTCIPTLPTESTDSAVIVENRLAAALSPPTHLA